MIAFFSFPDPDASPEIKYGISIFNNTHYEPCPYYVMAKIVDKWAIGEIKPYADDQYITTYYEDT